MILKLFILVFSILVSVLCYAKLSSTPESQLQLAITTPDRLQKMLKMYQQDLFLTGIIKQDKLIKELNLHLKSEGQFEIQKIDATHLMIDWDVRKPEALHVCIEGSQLYLKEKSRKDPVIQDLNQVDSQNQGSFATLKSLMELDSARLFKEFTVSDSTRQLFLDSPKLKVRINFNVENLIKRISFTEASGDVLQIDFLNIKKLSKSKAKLNCRTQLSLKP